MVCEKFPVISIQMTDCSPFDHDYAILQNQVESRIHFLETQIRANHFSSSCQLCTAHHPIGSQCLSPSTCNHCTFNHHCSCVHQQPIYSSHKCECFGRSNQATLNCCKNQEKNIQHLISNIKYIHNLQKPTSPSFHESLVMPISQSQNRSQIPKKQRNLSYKSSSSTSKLAKSQCQSKEKSQFKSKERSSNTSNIQSASGLTMKNQRHKQLNSNIHRSNEYELKPLKGKEIYRDSLHRNRKHEKNHLIESFKQQSKSREKLAASMSNQAFGDYGKF